MVRPTFYVRHGKQWFDRAVALAALTVLAPPLLLLGLLVRWRLGRPVLFLQTRIGRDSKPFQICKLRTMRDARDAQGQPLPDEQRLTSLGRFLRKTSLDELPELWNVVRGDMSLVGPRPLLPEYLPHYTEREARRHEVTPGLTGWAQINGRNALSWEERFRLDVWYVDHVSFGLDLKILILTIAKVLDQQGISAEGHATMPKFSRAVTTPFHPG